MTSSSLFLLGLLSVAANRIHIVQRAQLNVEAYNSCVVQSENAKIYAQSWYLDSVADEWYVLVQGEYEAVMPIPFRRKLGLTYVYQPVITQQLGVFSAEKVDIKLFFRKMLSRHLHVDYVYHGPTRYENSNEKPNCILTLTENLDSLLSRNRKRNYKAALEAGLKIEFNVPWNRNEDQISDLTSKFGGPNWNHIKNLSTKSIGKKGHFLRCDVSLDDEVIYVLFYGLDQRRIYHLSSVILSEKAKTTFATAFTIIKLVDQYRNTHKILDFEGSAIEGVQKFFKSFGAQIEPYYHIKKSFYQLLKHAR